MRGCTTGHVLLCVFALDRLSASVSLSYCLYLSIAVFDLTPGENTQCVSVALQISSGGLPNRQHCKLSAEISQRQQF